VPDRIAGDRAGEQAAGLGGVAQQAGVAGEVVVHEGAGAGDEARAGEEGFLGFGDALELAQGVGPGDPRTLKLGLLGHEVGREGEHGVPVVFRHGEFEAHGERGGSRLLCGLELIELGARLGGELEGEVTEGVGEAFFRGYHGDTPKGTGAGGKARGLREKAQAGLEGERRAAWLGGMIHPGLVSITFRKLAVAEVIARTRRAGLAGIEWGGDVHAPHGDVAVAKEVRARTEDAGLKIAAYGSYYRAGAAAGTGPDFGAVLDSAQALGAPTIRVWPGVKSSAETSAAERAAVVADLRRCADLATRAGLSLALEYHGNTLTDTDASARRLLDEVAHAKVFTYWQPHNGAETAQAVAGLRAVAERVSHVHVFHWWPTAQQRHPLAAGAERWGSFWPLLAALPETSAPRGGRFAMLEFIPEDSEEGFYRDAATLRAWCQTGHAASGQALAG
jgi:3-dehydroshikimate dehydratase